MTGRLDVDDVLAVLRARHVLDAFGIDYPDETEVRLRQCPACGRKARRGREAFVINLKTGMWCDHCGTQPSCKGGVLDLLAAFMGRDIKTEFRVVLERAAEIAGISPSTDDAELARMREQRQRERDEHARREAEADAAARAAMPALWDSLDRRSLVGERYLERRGIDPRPLRDVVRFAADGKPALPLRDLATGAIVGVQYRAVDGSEPKTPMAYRSQAAGSALHGKLADLDPDGVDVAVIVEGLADTLVALLAFPGCAVFGAPGWKQLETIAEAVAPRVRECRGWLLLVPHDDEQGVTGGIAAKRAAERAGMRLGDDLHLVDLGEHKDLADAWCAGWRWRWPSAQRPEGTAS